MSTTTPTKKRRTKKRRPKQRSANTMDLSAYDPGWFIILYGTQGMGKSSLAANMPDVCFFAHENEASIITLIKNNLVPKDTAIWNHLFTRKDWDRLIDDLHEFARQDEFSHLAIDSLKWLEGMCFQHCIDTDYDGNEKDFMAYSKGQKMTAPRHWETLIEAFQAIKASGKNIMLLAHARKEFYQNPHGPDYHRTIVDMTELNLFDAMQNSTDAVLFYTPLLNIHKDKKKGDTKYKATADGDERELLTQGFGPFIAKQKMGIPYSIPMADNPKECWEALRDAIAHEEE